MSKMFHQINSSFD